MFYRPDIHVTDASQGQKVVFSMPDVQVLEAEQAFLCVLPLV